MSNDQPTPDVETVLAAHAPHVGPVSGSWTCPSPCNAMSTNGHINDDSLTSREEREAEHRAHVAAVLEPLIREREAKALEDAADEWPGGPTGAAPIPPWWLRDRAATHREQP